MRISQKLRAYEITASNQSPQVLKRANVTNRQTKAIENRVKS